MKLVGRNKRQSCFNSHVSAQVSAAWSQRWRMVNYLQWGIIMVVDLTVLQVHEAIAYRES